MTRTSTPRKMILLPKRAVCKKKMFQHKERALSEPNLQPSLGLRKCSRRGSQTASMLIRGFCGYSDSSSEQILGSSCSTFRTESTVATESSSNYDWADSSFDLAEQPMDWCTTNKVVVNCPIVRGVLPLSVADTKPAPAHIPDSECASQSRCSTPESTLTNAFDRVTISRKSQPQASGATTETLKNSLTAEL